MNTELERRNGNEKNIQTAVFSNDDYCQNGVDIQCEFKVEVHSEGEDGEECVVRQQMTEKYVEFPMKNENTDPKGTTDDESMAVEALRQLGGMFETVLVPPPSSPPPPPPPSTPPPSPPSDATTAPFREHYCSICGESFERKTDLENHTVCHQVDRPHACRTCGNLFRRKADLKSHMVCHQMERPHRCPQCGADFQRPSSLTNHMKLHTYIPGRALHISSTSVPLPLPNYFPPTTSTQSNQPISNKVSVEPVSSYNGWDGNVLPQNQNLETPVTSSNHQLTYQSLEPKQYSQTPDMSKIQGQRCHTSTPTTAAHPGNITQSGSNISNFDNVTQVHYTTKNQNFNFNSDGCGETAVKVEPMPYVSAVNCPSTEETYNCPPVVEHPQPSINNSQRPHICHHCGLAFAREKALESHARLHQDHWGSPVECDKCEEMFPEDISLRQHQETCLGKVVGTPQQNQQPQQHHHQQQIERFKTNPCSVNPSLNVAQPAKMGKHACPECEKRFTSKQKLHRMSKLKLEMHGAIPLLPIYAVVAWTGTTLPFTTPLHKAQSVDMECDVCLHMWIHRKRPSVCEVCGISLADRGALDEHRRTQHTGDTPYTCNECGKSFSSRQGLWEHGRRHAAKGTRSCPFLCQHCGKGFASREGHLIHTRIHTGERPYGCRYCWKAFRDGGTLRKHERIHTGERPHVCPLCLRAFNQKVVLREHVRWVHAARNSDSCQLCGYVTGDREALCAHIVKHSDQLAAAAKAAKAKEEPSKTAGAQGVLTRVNSTEPPSLLPSEPYDVANFIPSDGLSSESPNSNMNSTTLPEIKAEYTCVMCLEVFKFRTELLDHVRIHI